MLLKAASACPTLGYGRTMIFCGYWFLFFSIFQSTLKWNKISIAKDNTINYFSGLLISDGRWKVNLLKWFFLSAGVLFPVEWLWKAEGAHYFPWFFIIIFFAVVLENNFLWHVAGCFMALRNILVYSSVATIIILPLESNLVINQAIPFYSIQIIKIKFNCTSEFVLQAE